MSQSDWREKDYLSCKDIQKILCISEGSAYQLMHRLPHFRIGSTYRVSTAAFRQWIKDQERKCER